jgi:hypothetical protein
VREREGGRGRDIRMEREREREDRDVINSSLQVENCEPGWSNILYSLD